MQGRHPEPGLKEVVIECVRHFSRGTFTFFLAGQLQGVEAPPEDEGAVVEPASVDMQPPPDDGHLDDEAMLQADAAADAEVFGMNGEGCDDAEFHLVDPGLGFDDP